MCNSLGHGEYHVILTSIGCFVLGGVRIYLNCELEGTTFLAKSINQWPMPPACPSAKFLTLWWQHRPLALFPLSLSPDQEMQIWFLCPRDIWPLNLGWRIQPRPYLSLFFWSVIPSSSCLSAFGFFSLQKLALQVVPRTEDSEAELLWSFDRKACFVPRCPLKWGDLYLHTLCDSSGDEMSEYL